jgi:hypothetical protein
MLCKSEGQSCPLMEVKMQATHSHGIDWFVGSNGNLFGDYAGFRYCIARLSSGEYVIARDGDHIAHAPSDADAKLIIKRDGQ